MDIKQGSPKALVSGNSRNRNLCIGPYAGIDLTTEENLLVINLGDKELRTQISDEEFELLYEIIGRCEVT